MKKISKLAGNVLEKALKLVVKAVKTVFKLVINTPVVLAKALINSPNDYDGFGGSSPKKKKQSIVPNFKAPAPVSKEDSAKRLEQLMARQALADAANAKAAAKQQKQ